MGNFTLYTPDNEEDKEAIEADLSAGYDVMLDNIQDSYESEGGAKSDVCRVVETTVFQTIQESNDSEELHDLIAELLRGLDERGAVDVDKLVEQSIHQLTQISDN